MQQISSALALYKLDNKHYPPVLFSYACDSAATATNGASPGCNVSDTMKNLSADPNATGLFGLYPTYIKDWHVFTSPANTIDDPAATTNPINVNIINGRSLTAAQRSFFKMDAFDASPQVTAINQADQNGTAYVPRYQTSWTDYTPAATSGSGSSYDSRCFPTGACTDTSGNDITDPDYKRQLRWSDPPSNTYVTCTTDHVPNANKVLVMYLDGSVKKINYLSDWATNPPSNTSYTALEAGFYDNISDISPVTAGGTAQMSAALFWRTTATR
jgi:hypothetical protein